MRLTKKKARTIKWAIETWIQEGVLSPKQGSMLLNRCEIVGFDWKRLSRYSFWISIICMMIASGAVLADAFLMKLLASLFKAPDAVKCLFMSGAAAMLYAFGIRRRSRNPEKVFSSEALFFLGVLATAGAVTFLGHAISTGSGHFSLLVLLAAVIYGVIGLWIPSKLVWSFSLLSIGSWMGAETGYMSGWGAYYLGMNYPLRFVLFGLALVLASEIFVKWPARRAFLRPTRAVGLLHLFVALWIMSIFGNYGDMEVWTNVKQIELLHWSLLFGLTAAASIWHGIREDDGMTRGFGITFLFINLYTRFFEYFWESTHKALFFAVLAASFWWLGSRAEKIWNLGGGSAGEQAGDGESANGP